MIFTCPRCGDEDLEDELYGPCQTCRNEMRASVVRGEPDPGYGPAEALPYDPKDDSSRARPVPKR